MFGGLPAAPGPGASNAASNRLAKTKCSGDGMGVSELAAPHVTPQADAGERFRRARNRKRRRAWATIASIMSDQEVILRALELVRRRLRLARALRDAAIVSGMVAVLLVLWRVLYLFPGRAPLLAAAVLAALLLLVAGVLLLVRSALIARCPLGVAAALADARAGLSDELQSAHWFLQHPAPSPWVEAQVAHAAQSARGLEPAALFPLRFGRRGLVAAGAAPLMVVVAWLVPPLAPPSDAAVTASPEVQASQVQVLREVADQVRDETAARKLREAIAAVESRGATGEEKQRALAEAQRAVEQQDLEAASAREGLYRVADKLRGQQRLEEVAKALEEGDAARAARLVQRMAQAPGAEGREADSSVESRSDERDLERLLDVVARGQGAEQSEAASAAAKETVDRLREIAQQLDTQERLSQSARTLQQLQLSVAQRSQLAAGRFGQQAAQNSTPAPQTGQTSMPGGVMFRTTAVARETTPSAQQEGSKTGSALGDSRADPVLGAKATSLEVQLKQEAVPDRPQQDDRTGAGWFYTESRQQAATLGFEEVRAPAQSELGQSTAVDAVSIRHRRMVKNYFTTLRQDPTP